MSKKFIGWTNIKWLFKELIATCSNKPSYFSKKRLQAWILFLGAIVSAAYWFWTHVDKMTYSECIAFVSMLMVYAGYTMSTIQKEKKETRDDS